MGRKRISGIAFGADQAGGRARRSAARKPARRPPGLTVIERDGRFHLSGRIRIKGRSIRIRGSTGLAALPANREAAEELRRQKEQEVRDAVLWGIHPTVPLAVAAKAYLKRQRKRPLNPIDVSRIKELDRKFGARRLSEITEAEWNKFVDARMTGRAAVTRERFIDLVVSFLKWCKDPPQRWLSELPVFNRDREAREHKEARASRRRSAPCARGIIDRARRTAFARANGDALVDRRTRVEPDLRLPAVRLFGGTRARADHLS